MPWSSPTAAWWPTLHCRICNAVPAFQAVTLAADTPLDLLALAVLPGVAGIEEDRHAPGKVTVLAMPGHSIFPSINALITHRGWNITSMNLEPGRLNDVVHHLSHEVNP